MYYQIGDTPQRGAISDSTMEGLDDFSASVGAESEGISGMKTEWSPYSFHSPTLRLSDILDYEKKSKKNMRAYLAGTLQDVLSIAEGDVSGRNENQDVLNWCKEAVKVG